MISDWWNAIVQKEAGLEELYGSLFTRSDGRIDLILNFDFAKHQLIKARIDPPPFLPFFLSTPDSWSNTEIFIPAHI